MLDNLRKEIDVIDLEIVEKLAQRFEVTRQIGALKQEHGVAFKDDTRENERIASVREIARTHNVNEAFVESVWRLMMTQVVLENSNQ